MALNFPDSPSDGDTFLSWEWDATKGVWSSLRGEITHVIPSATPPVNAPSNVQWLNTNDGTLFVRYDDGDSTQWIESKNTASYVNSVELASAENRLTTLETAAQGGYYVRQFTVHTDTTDRTFGTSWTLAITWPSLGTFLAGSMIDITYTIPFRNDYGGWGGAYVEPQISFNNGGTYYSCGSSGFDGGVMTTTGGEIATYHQRLLINPYWQGITGSYTPLLRMYVRSYEGTLWWNYNHDLTARSGTAADLTTNANSKQHYAKIIVQELAPRII